MSGVMKAYHLVLSSLNVGVLPRFPTCRRAVPDLNVMNKISSNG